MKRIDPKVSKNEVFISVGILTLAVLVVVVSGAAIIATDSTLWKISALLIFCIFSGLIPITATILALKLGDYKKTVTHVHKMERIGVGERLPDGTN